jgi:hypothetical protein
MTQAEKLPTVEIYFSDFFQVSPALLEEYGAFNVSLVNDLPVFIDPFLLFNSANPAYQQLHRDIIHYLRFLRDRSVLAKEIDAGLLKAWYRFGEVKQNWLGFSRAGNEGSGLGNDFARALHEHLGAIFSDFGQERIARGSHLEKLCLVSSGVGRDNISDFTTNLIKGYLLEYTQSFALNHLRPQYRERVVVDRVRFNYETESWERGWYELPYYAGDFVLLTPKDMLTRDEIWISRKDLLNDFPQVAASISDDALRAQLDNYLRSQLATDSDRRPTKQNRQRAVANALRTFPAVLDYYIRYKEDQGDQAAAISSEKVSSIETQFIKQLGEFVASHLAGTEFYERHGDTYEEARRRVLFLKNVIENRDGYRIFYLKGEPIQREQDLQLLYLLTWYATPSDVNREVNNGRGPVDFKVSRGNRDKSLVEFKLAKNSQLKRNLEKQVPIYEQASGTQKSLKVICYFSPEELEQVQGILRELKMEGHPDIILIDARADNKPSASKA